LIIRGWRLLEGIQGEKQRKTDGGAMRLVG
jgi:hypothetical protein